MIKPEEREKVFGEICHKVLIDMDKGFAIAGADFDPPTGYMRKMLAEAGTANSVSLVTTMVAALAGSDPEFNKMFQESVKQLKEYVR